jgi:uncharacterized membrane protein YdjX (TVP38/TMEM64 family)
MRARVLWVAAAVVVAIAAVALAWLNTDLARFANADEVGRLLSRARDAPWAPAMVVAAFVASGLVAFPLNIMVLATAAVFGPRLGLLYSAIGLLCNAVVLYGAGRYLGRMIPAQAFLPVLPFTITSLAAGASAIRFSDYMIGTVLGCAPGTILLALIGDRIVAMALHPTLGEISTFLLCVAAYLALVVGAQALLSRRR